MPTIKDIAREAGVSHGTVSNVINGRGNVSVEKIRLVWQAAEQLGYKVNTKAQSLRQGKDKAIAVLLPSMEYERYAALYEVFQHEFTLHGYTVQLYLTQALETTEQAMLTEALNARVSAVIAATCLRDAASKYRSEAADLPVVLLQSNGPSYEGVLYAGFDWEQAGREIGERLCAQGAKTVGVLTDEALHLDTGCFLRGLQATCAQGKVALRAIDCPDHQIELRSFELFEPDSAYDYIVCGDRRRTAAVRAAHAYASRCPLPRFITLAPRAAVADPTELIYTLDEKRLAHRVVKGLLAKLEGGLSLPPELRLPCSGFSTPPVKTPVSPVRTLRLLTVASPSSAALSRLLPHLEKTCGIRLEMTVLPLRDVYDTLQTPGRLPYDLIRMDTAWLDELACRIYMPLDQADFDWDGLLARVIPELRSDYTSSYGVRCCLPYDPSTQLLFYRRDLFEDPTYKRMYFESCREELAVPRSFTEYNRIARFFTKSFNPYSPTQYGTTVAIGNAVVSPSEFMPRLFEAGGRLLDPLGRVTLDTPEALRALENYSETYTYSDRTVYQWWKNVLEGFADGSAAMTVVFINHASDILNLKRSSIAGKLGFAPVPGAKPLLGGGVIGIPRDCTQVEDACAFLTWLYSDPIAPVFTMLGGLSPCRASYNSRDIHEKYPWLSAARKSFPFSQRRGNSSYYSNFSELQLENLLAAQVQKAVLGVCTPQQALRQAQADCDRYFRPWD